MNDYIYVDSAARGLRRAARKRTGKWQVQRSRPEEHFTRLAADPSDTRWILAATPASIRLLKSKGA